MQESVLHLVLGCLGRLAQREFPWQHGSHLNSCRDSRSELMHGEESLLHTRRWPFSVRCSPQVYTSAYGRVVIAPRPIESAPFPDCSARSWARIATGYSY